MGDKLESNKKQKKEALLNTAFELFTSKGIQKTSISDIVEKAGVAKGTFYLYFSDKYDIRNKLISHKASQLFKNAYKQMLSSHIQDFEDQVIFIANHILDQLSKNKSMLSFISKHLSWGMFKNVLTAATAEGDVSAYTMYEHLIQTSGHNFKDPEIMIFTILEMVSGISYNTILYSQPVTLEEIKPYVYTLIRQIIHNHYND